MPIYEYQCRTCGAVFDALRSVRDDDREVECPRCADKNAERRISLTATDNSLRGGCGPSRPGRMRFG